MKRNFGDEYEICPLTFILSEEYPKLLAEREADPKSFWIIKPVASSCGRGIKLISKKGKIQKKP